MEEDKKVVVNVLPKEGVERMEVIIREGSADKLLDPKAPIKILLSGTFFAPFEFLAKRISEADQINQKRCHVLVNREKISLRLVMNETDEYSRAEVIGTLNEHPKFKEFGINQGKKWEPNELGQFLKMNRAFFPDKSKNMLLVTQLKNFFANVNSVVEKEKSEKGDFKDNFSGTVTSNLPETFTIELPIFKGTHPSIIEVEFYANVSGREVTLQLYSPGANQLLEELRDEVINKQITQIACLAPEIAIIEE